MGPINCLVYVANNEILELLLAGSKLNELIE